MNILYPMLLFEQPPGSTSTRLMNVIFTDFIKNVSWMYLIIWFNCYLSICIQTLNKIQNVNQCNLYRHVYYLFFKICVIFDAVDVQHCSLKMDLTGLGHHDLWLVHFIISWLYDWLLKVSKSNLFNNWSHINMI